MGAEECLSNWLGHSWGDAGRPVDTIDLKRNARKFSLTFESLAQTLGYTYRTLVIRMNQTDYVVPVEFVECVL